MMTSRSNYMDLQYLSPKEEEYMNNGSVEQEVVDKNEFKERSDTIKKLSYKNIIK